MAIFEKENLRIICEQNNADLFKAAINTDLSAVSYDEEGKFFYITIDRVLFSGPVTIIRSVLDAHGYVPNLENILSCLDSCVFSIYAKVIDQKTPEVAPAKVNEYLPCLRFELPQKNKVGDILQSFYDEISKYESRQNEPKTIGWGANTDTKTDRELNKEIERLKADNRQLAEQVEALTQRLIAEQSSHSRAARALESQQALPENTRICRVEHVDFKRRLIRVKSVRKVIDIPTHMLDKVPDYQARCLITFDEDDKVPMGILFFNSEELGSIEKRTAELLYVEGDTFKARDSMRNEFQIKAVNAMEADTIKALRRGMKVLISVADDYVVRFSVLNANDQTYFKRAIQEQFVVYEIGRNQLVDLTVDDSE